MTEAEWDSTDKLHDMWQVLMASRKRTAVQLRKRKFRLMACAFCRCGWAWLTDERSRRAVEVAELAADALATPGELEQAKQQAWAAYCDGAVRWRGAGRSPTDGELNYGLVEHAAGWVANKDVKHAAGTASTALSYVRVKGKCPKNIWEATDLIREVFGNRYRPLVIDSAWLTSTVVSLAQAAYEQRILPAGELDRDRLGVLADALEDAGCTEAAILNHLRGPGPHVRGCFVVDGLLGRV
jgi:hypothetical protein